MLEIQKMISAELKAATIRIKQKMRKYSASGKTLESIKTEMLPDGGQIVADKSIVYVERGRGPAKKSTPKWNLASLIGWMQIRGIGSDLDAKGKKNLASFIKYKINKEGTKTWQKGKGEVVNDVYTTIVEELSEDLEAKLINKIEGEFNLNFKGKNVTVN